MTRERLNSKIDLDGHIPCEEQFPLEDQNVSDHSQDQDSNKCNWLIIHSSIRQQDVTTSLKIFLDSQGYPYLKFPYKEYLIAREIDQNNIWAYLLCKQEDHTTVAFVLDQDKLKYLKLVDLTKDMSSLFGLTMAKLKNNPYNP